ncbi:hypothetical protein B9Z55_013018 [Caenorhabditis nigoni]|nr:hypothetical protein B9Z55_013018 [Caenorhabditis nigoni]
MMEATRYQVKPKNENASYGNPSREQQLAHLRETLHDLPTAESLAELIIPSAPPLEETYEDNSAFSLYNGPVIPSAPPMEDSNHNGAVFQFQQSDQTVYSAIKNTPSSNVKASKTIHEGTFGNLAKKFLATISKKIFCDHRPKKKKRSPFFKIIT